MSQWLTVRERLVMNETDPDLNSFYGHFRRLRARHLRDLSREAAAGKTAVVIPDTLC